MSSTGKPKERPAALGRGLDALLPAAGAAVAGNTAGVRSSQAAYRCPIELISPQVGQPRRHIDEAALDELAASIREHGLLEPVLVRRSPKDPGRFELIAGERRWRAAQRAGLTEILAIIKDVSPSQAFELALIENIQREELNPIELSEALDRLILEHKYTHETLAAAIKKDRSTVTNSLRLLKLPPSVRSMVVDGRLSEGHARALLPLESESAITSTAEQIARGKLSVRKAEALVKEHLEHSGKKKPTSPPEPKAAPRPAAVRDMERRLRTRLGAKVEVHDEGGQGTIVIHYASLDELDRVLATMLDS